MTTTSSVTIMSLAITSISSDFFLWVFGLLQDRLECCFICQVGWGVQDFLYWRHWWWQGLRRAENLSMFPPVHNSCGHLWTSGFHAVSDSSFWLGHISPSDWGLDHYHLAGHLLSHPYWGWRVWCGGSGVYEWPCRQNFWHGHHRRGPVYWACLLLMMSLNASLPSSSHPCSCTTDGVLWTTQYFWNVVVKILGVVFCLVNYHRWHESLAIIYGEYEVCAPEGCYIYDIVTPHPISSEEFISTDQFIHDPLVSKPILS